MFSEQLDRFFITSSASFGSFLRESNGSLILLMLYCELSPDQVSGDAHDSVLPKKGLTKSGFKDRDNYHAVGGSVRSQVCVQLDIRPF
jgi:hypothetical protein